jgi:hypothetical protein
LYAAGVDDATIARVLRLTRTQVAAVRGEWGLKANAPREAIKDYMHFYLRGFPDADIASATKTSPDMVRRWRERNDLPPGA